MRTAEGNPTGGVGEEDSMKRSMRRVAALALLGFLLAIGVSTAQAGRVNFERETHFRCYTISAQTPQPAQTVTLSDQFLQDVTLTIDEPSRCSSVRRPRTTGSRSWPRTST